MLTYPLFIGTTELIIIVVIVLLLFGGKKIPELMRGLGKGVKSFKEGINEIDDEVKKLEKAKEITEDESKKCQSDVQKLVDKYIKNIDKVKEDKEKDLMEV